ncbi:MAG: radical SAM protein, partial [Bacillota bacterium]|nr:radical SAM protein [Bacillota bacterium]
RQKGLNIPIVYNSGGYENTDTIKLLDGIIDIYMPDFKYMSSSLSEKYSNASNYSEIVKKAIEAMVSEVGDLEFDEDGMMKKGVLIRHMLLPGCLDDSKEVMKYLYDTYKEKVYYSIMSQYTPLAWVKDYPEINRKVTKEEYEELIDFCVDMGMENAFVQEGEAAEESFIPMFDCEGV